MDFKNIIDLIARANVDQEAMYDLVREASSLDLNDEENIRRVIRKGCALANKTLSLEQEDRIVMLLKDKGITPDLFKLLKN
ncbi:MAG: stage VI sporulation protein F [Anaeroplasmataceae bacterium]|nr:stage VI sporulation protein F [Anaeroplasmataceae bacterium]